MKMSYAQEEEQYILDKKNVIFTVTKVLVGHFSAQS
jgi:hypothetical protein